jgi:TRAP-type C4-dicarboxylate transport system permease small subunit
MSQILRALELAVQAVAATLLVAFTVLVLVDVLCRYWLHVSIPWVPELTVFLFQWTAFLGSALALRRGMHFGLGLLLHKVWPRFANLMGLFVAFIVTASSLMLLVLAVKMVIRTWEGTYSTLEISQGWAYVGVAVSAGLMVLFGAEHAYRLARHGRDEGQA